MSSEPRDYLRHLLVESDYLIKHSAGLTFDAVNSDETHHLSSLAPHPDDDLALTEAGLLEWTAALEPGDSR